MERIMNREAYKTPTAPGSADTPLSKVGGVVLVDDKKPLVAEFSETINGVTFSLRVQAPPESLRTPFEDFQSVVGDFRFGDQFPASSREMLPALDEAKRLFFRSLEVAFSKFLEGRCRDLDEERDERRKAAEILSKMDAAGIKVDGV